MTAFEAPDERYFTQLIGYSKDFVGRLALGREPLALDAILGDLKSRIEALRLQEVATIAALPMTRSRRSPRPDLAAGLNTVGLLADRLTILIVKEWSLRNRAGDAAKADMVSARELPAIGRALAQVEPDQRHYLGKVSSIRAGARAESWAEAYYGLLAANLMLWEAQEILYTRDILVLSESELRAYIRWFSAGNMLRNEFMELCERLLWSGR